MAVKNNQSANNILDNAQSSMQQQMLELQDAIYQAGVIAAKSEIQKSGYDITRKCVIVDDSNWENGEYLVRYGTTPFTAYSQDDTHYETNEVVYVQIPKGDMDQQKFIIGREVTDENETPYNYQFPFDDFVALKQLIEPSNEQHGYRANQHWFYDSEDDPSVYSDALSSLLTLETTWEDTISVLPLSEDNSVEDQTEVEIYTWMNSSDTPGPTIGDQLGITCHVSTLLDIYRPISGEYGLHIYVEGLQKSDNSDAITTMKSKQYTFSCKQMYGNPYAFTMSKEQQIVFDVSEFLRLTQVRICFYQDHSFFDQYNRYIKWRRTETELFNPNIIFDNIGVYLGFKASELKKDQIFLYTYDDYIYGRNPDSLRERPEMDRKTMYVAYVHYDQATNQYLLYDSQEEFDNGNVQIYWYVRDNDWFIDSSNPLFDGSKSEHKYGGLYWAPMDGEDTTLPHAISTVNSPIYGQMKYTFVPEIEKSTYRFKVAIYNSSSQTYMISDICQFENVKDVETELQDIARNNKIIIRLGTVMETEEGVKAICYSDDFTNFFVYDENNNALISDDKRTYTIDGVTYKFPDQKRYSDLDWFAEVWIKEDILDDVDYSSIAQESRPQKLNGYVRLSDVWYAFDTGSDGLPTPKYVPFYVEWGEIKRPSMINNFTKLGYNLLSELPYYNARNQQQIILENSQYTDAIFNTKFDVDKMTTRQFKIAPTYDINANHNTIVASVKRNGQEYTAKCELLFGGASAQGCPYTPIITIEEPISGTYVVAERPFTLRCMVQDNYGHIYNGGFSCEWEFFGNHPVRDGNAATNWTGENQLDGVNSIYTGVVHDTDSKTKPFSVKCTVKKSSGDGAVPLDYDIYAVRGILVASQNGADWISRHTVISVERIEFDADGQLPHYASNVFEVLGPPRVLTSSQYSLIERMQTAMASYVSNDIAQPQQDYLAARFTSDEIATVEEILDTEINRMSLLDLKRITEKELYYPEWKLNAPIGLMDTLYLLDDPIYVSKRYRVPESALSENNGQPYNNLYYQIYDADTDRFTNVNYNNPNNTRVYGEDVRSKLLYYYKAVDYATYYNGEQESAPNCAQYSLKFGKEPDGTNANNSGGGESNYWQWKDELQSDDYFTWLTFSINDPYTDTTVRISQGIAFFRYLYSSSLVDQWNGSSLTLDQESGTILATRIAAGTKNSNNQFTGVMMGSWADKSRAQFLKDKTGLYGFQNGAVSFGFMEDGTGFIGPAGAGRIQFDGRNAMISNSTQTCYINLNPSQLTYKNDSETRNWYDASDKGKSQYFLYCKVPVDIYRTLTTNQPDVEDQTMKWTEPFLEDSSNNYFIVDPNHGAVISAGIATRYGRIGNWFINDTGLYQEYVNPNDSSKNRFMYLGMPAYSTIDTTELEEKLGDNRQEYNTYVAVNNELLQGLNELQKIRKFYEYRRDVIKGEIVEEWQPSSLEERVRTLSKYLNFSEFDLDVYHWYTFGTAARNVSAYLKRKIAEFFNLPDNEHTEANLWTLVYDMNAITNMTNSTDFSEDGPLSLRNIETYLHNHYDTAGSNGANWNYHDNNGANVMHTYTAGTRYRYTAQYGYLTNMSSLLNGFTVGTLTYWDPEIAPNGSFALDEDGKYPSASVQYDNSYNWPYATEATDYAKYLRVTAIGEVAPRLINEPSISTPSGSSTVTIRYNKNSDVSLSDVPLPTGDLITTSSTSFTVTNSCMQRGRGTINLSELQRYCNALDKVYEYYHKCFNYQLAEMLVSGLNILRNKDYDAYTEAQAILNSMGGISAIQTGGLEVLQEDYSYIEGLSGLAQARAREQMYQAKQEEIQEKLAELSKEYDALMKEINRKSDGNRYAIYAGYNSPLRGADLAPDPFFSVRWNGYMTARHGKIGKDSPWYISDAGLTQTNNFGTIFLGSPDQDGQPSSAQNLCNPNKASFMDEFGNPISISGENGSSTNAYLLKNGGAITLPQNMIANAEESMTKYLNVYSVLEGTKDEYNRTVSAPTKTNKNVWVRYHDDHYWLYLGKTNGEIDEIQLSNITGGANIENYLGPNAFGELGRFAIYAGKNQKIHFGVRLDGTLYTDRGNIGTWLLDNDTLGTYTYYTINGSKVLRPKIELSSRGYITIDNGNIYLDGTNPSNAIIRLGSISNNAEVIINDFRLVSTSNSNFSSNMSGTQVNSSTDITTDYIWQDMRNINQDSINYETMSNEELISARSSTLTELNAAQAELNSFGMQQQVKLQIIKDSTNNGTPANPDDENSVQIVGDVYYYIYDVWSEVTEYYSQDPNDATINTALGNSTTTLATLYATYEDEPFIASEVLLDVGTDYVVLANTSGCTAAKRINQSEITRLQEEITAFQNTIVIIQAILDSRGVNYSVETDTTDRRYPVALGGNWNFTVRIGDNGASTPRYFTGDKLEFLDANSGTTENLKTSTGLTLALGREYEEDENGTITWLDNYATVLTPKYRGTGKQGYLEGWNFKGDSVISNIVYGQTAIYMGSAKKLVATQSWVDEKVKTPITQRVVTVNNTANDALTKAVEALNGVKTNQAKIAEVANAAANAAARAIVDFSVTNKHAGNSGVTWFEFRFQTAGGAEIASSSKTIQVYAANGSHAHHNWITSSDGKVSTKIGIVSGSETKPCAEDALIFGGDDAISFTAGDDGKIKFSITIAKKTGEKDFNLADTKFYKENGYGSYSIGSYDSTNQTYPLTITAVDDETKLVDEDDIDVSDAYDDGYAAGWAAAITHAKANASIDLTAATAKLTYTAKYVGTVTTSDGTYPSEGTATFYTGAAGVIDTEATASINWDDVSSTPPADDE